MGNYMSDKKMLDKSLSKVLKKSEQIKHAVKECAEDLTSINTVLKKELAHEKALIAKTIKKNTAVEDKVHDAQEQLSLVNEALKDEVEAREMLEQALEVAKTQEEKSSHAALHDSLTGLPNRALFNDRLDHGLNQASRHQWTLAIFFLDLDGFKMINDTHGHDSGDVVLKIIAERLCAITRADDTLSRYGGDEFLYLLMEVRYKKDITAIVKKIIAEVEKPCKVGKLNLIVKSSIGISVFPKNGKTADVLLKSADAAMYQAKKNKSGYAFA